LRSVTPAAARAAEDGWAGARADAAAPEMKLPTAMCGGYYAPRGRSSRPAGRMPDERAMACAWECMPRIYRHSREMATRAARPVTHQRSPVVAAGGGARPTVRFLTCS